MRGKKRPPLEFVEVAAGTPLTFEMLAQAYLEDYVLQRYRALSTVRVRVNHLGGMFGGWRADAISADGIRADQLYRRQEGAEAATVIREPSTLSRMLKLAGTPGRLERLPTFPKRLQENPPRDGFFEHAEYLSVRAHLPPSYQDVLDFAYYSGWRRNENLGPHMAGGRPRRQRRAPDAASFEDQNGARPADLDATPRRLGSARASPKIRQPDRTWTPRRADSGVADGTARCLSQGACATSSAA